MNLEQMFFLGGGHRSCVAGSRHVLMEHTWPRDLFVGCKVKLPPQDTSRAELEIRMQAPAQTAMNATGNISECTCEDGARPMDGPGFALADCSPEEPKGTLAATNVISEELK